MGACPVTESVLTVLWQATHMLLGVKRVWNFVLAWCTVWQSMHVGAVPLMWWSLKYPASRALRVLRRPQWLMTGR